MGGQVDTRIQVHEPFDVPKHYHVLRADFSEVFHQDAFYRHLVYGYVNKKRWRLFDLNLS